MSVRVEQAYGSEPECLDAFQKPALLLRGPTAGIDDNRFARLIPCQQGVFGKRVTGQDLELEHRFSSGRLETFPPSGRRRSGISLEGAR